MEDFNKQRVYTEFCFILGTSATETCTLKFAFGEETKSKHLSRIKVVKWCDFC